MLDSEIDSLRLYLAVRVLLDPDLLHLLLQLFLPHLVAFLLLHVRFTLVLALHLLRLLDPFKPLHLLLWLDNGFHFGSVGSGVDSNRFDVFDQIVALEAHLTTLSLNVFLFFDDLESWREALLARVDHLSVRLMD